MTAYREACPVVVGVGGHGSLDAVEWAAAEAAARRSALLVVHAYRRPPMHIDPCGLVPVVVVPPAVPVAAERLVSAAVRRARAVAPELDLTTHLFAGAPFPILLVQSRRAALLVLGGRHRGGVHRSLTASRAGRLSARTRCPVIVVRAGGQRRSEPTPPRVVVGIDATPSCVAAIGFAFRAARQRGIPLAAVHAWHLNTAAVADAGRTLDRALGRWREEFPDVPVLTRLAQADPGRALIGESVGAALVVVGSRPRGAVMAGLRDSISRTVLLQAHSAVAVVRSGGAEPYRAGAGRRSRSPATRGGADSAVT
jgi:nucleotide-binding universal stress UspA family protein